MNDAAQLHMLALEEIAYPITWRYILQTPHGFTSQTLTCDVPYLVDKPEFAAPIGAKLWELSLALASCDSVQLVVIQTVQWKVSPIAVVQPVSDARGVRMGPVAPRDSTPVLVAHSGHLDGFGARRIYLPGAPASWVDDRVLQKDGAEALQELARGMILGIAPPHFDKDHRWLNYYPNVVTYEDAPFKRVGFRWVTHVRVCLFAERQPDLSVASFP